MYVHVAVARPLSGALTYAVPADLGPLRMGHVVLVPLGRQGETGYIIDVLERPDVTPSKIRPISRLLDPQPAFDEAQLSFLRWMADYYLAPLGMVIHTALPSGIRARTLRSLVPTDDGVLALTRGEVEGHDLQLLREAIARPGLTRRGMQRRLAAELERADVDRAMDRLVRKGMASWEDREVGGIKGRIRTVTRVAKIRYTSRPLGHRMRALLAALDAAGGTADLQDLIDAQGTSARAALKRLEDRGLVEIGEREQRDLLVDAPPMGSSTPPPLNADQRVAVAALSDPEASGTYLLFGVTGSGKTEVFLGAAQSALDRGRQVLVLVPEIGLTPQLVGRFRARFGDRVAVLHSGLTGAQRLAQWRRIRAGEVDVAVGARSALFAPFRDLGLLVVDEEHDDSYKQDEGVSYNARDLAVVLGQRLSCPVVLASATPSLESWFNAHRGRYTLLRLPNRATPRPVPQVELVNLTEDDNAGSDLLAPPVRAALRQTFDRGGQAIVLYNRRGYATQVQCTSCGATYECPNCAISMTLHKRSRRVACHYCGLKLTYTGVCPVCRSTHLDEAGKGTERIEERLTEMFPKISISRMDADTTRERGAHLRILSAFRDGYTQMLVGTQIVAKGHDFPGVHTAVVINADRGFKMPDFRAAERTAALLVQLAGRAGRGDVPGRVFVQTYKPDHYALQHLDQLESFYDVEMRLRSTLQYPPFARLCLIRIDGVDRSFVLSDAETLGRDLRQSAKAYHSVTILGPAPAALPRLVGRWRFQLIVRGGETAALRAFLREIRPRLEQRGRRGVRIHWDIDPRHLM
ncbi:MAG TPA: primosomal protein N' [Deltaproteobacteria bacterium]|nr:primosomal protein N' [Deltaproteobacteria bacterium]